MPLNQGQINQLIAAMNAYNFPPQCYDKATNTGIGLPNMTAVENRIKARLTSGNAQDVCEGLADVLYWGWAQRPGRAAAWAGEFLATVTPRSITGATRLFYNNQRPSLSAIAALGLPYFKAGVSFTSKIRAFLDPSGSAVLDLKLMQMRLVNPGVFAGITPRMGKNGQPDFIPLSQRHSAGYESYCNTLVRKDNYPQLRSYRAVDIERGLFWMVDQHQAVDAANILANI